MDLINVCLSNIELLHSFLQKASDSAPLWLATFDFANDAKTKKYAMNFHSDIEKHFGYYKFIWAIFSLLKSALHVKL